MRPLLTLLLTAALLPAARAEDHRTTDRAVSDALREVHDRGADLYNGGDTAGGYRMYQGGLVLARAMLAHRPEVQKLILDGMAAAEKQSSVSRRAFMLHELIEKVRVELRATGKTSGESVVVPPREVKPGPKPDPKPPAAVGEVKDGVIGRVLWQGKPLAGVEVTFVTVGRQPARVYETTSGAQGVYTIAGLPPGKYVVLITPGPKADVKKLPERYATSNTSPLTIDVKGTGEKVDFVLQ
jgi:hypothetical protein